MSRSKVKVTRDKKWHFSAHPVARMRFVFGKTSLASSFFCLKYLGEPLNGFTPYLYGRRKGQPIEMPFGLWTLVGPSNHVLDVGPDRPSKGATSRGEDMPRHV